MGGNDSGQDNTNPSSRANSPSAAQEKAGGPGQVPGLGASSQGNSTAETRQLKQMVAFYHQMLSGQA